MEAPKLLSIRPIEEQNTMRFPTTPVMNRSSVEGDRIPIPAGDVRPGSVREMAFSSPDLSSKSFDATTNRKGFRLRTKNRKRSEVGTNGYIDSEVTSNGFMSQPDLRKMDAMKRMVKVDVLDVPNPEPDETATNLWTCNPEGRVKIRMGEGMAGLKPMTIHSMFVKTVKRSPSHPALAYKKDPTKKEYTFINYAEYYRMVVTAAKGFIKLGLEPKHSVGIVGFNSVEWFVSDMAAIFAGGFACGIYTTNSPDACQYVASNANAQIIVVDEVVQMKKILAVRDQLPELKMIIQWKGEVPDSSDPMQMTWEQLMEVGKDLPDSSVEERLRPQVPNECCTLIYTSGTTGNPKGVMLSHDNITWTATFMASYAKLNYNRECLISYLPLSHVAAQVVDLYGSAILGGTIYFAQPDALKGSLGDTLREVRPTIFFGVPRVWEKIQEKMISIGRRITGPKKKLATWAKSVGYKGSMAQMVGRPTPWGWSLANMLVFSTVKKNLGLDRCRIFATAAAPITKETIDYFMSLNIPLMEVYGMSESSGPHTLSIPSKFCVTAVGVTPPGGETKLHQPDNEGNGEVCMASRNVFMGYLHQEEKTVETLDSEGWLHSGDVGKLDKNGFLFITGRIKELLITAGGENVAPVPVEDEVKHCLPCLSNCMLIGDKKKFLSILLTLKCEVDNEGEPLDTLSEPALDWLRTVGGCGPEVKTVSDVLRLCEDKDSSVSKAIHAGIAKANKSAVSRACYVQKWTILPKDFSLIGGELGPTMKLRRPIVTKMYASTIEKFYEE